MPCQRVDWKPRFPVSLVSIIFITSNNDYKVRYYEQVKVIFQPNGFSYYLKSSEYGAHFNTAYKMFLDNKLFGVGIKNKNQKRSISKHSSFS